MGYRKEKTEAQLAKGRAAEVNNGRLAMIGLFSVLAESKVRGAVPVLNKYDFPPYNGDLMAPFTSDFTFTTTPFFKFIADPSAGVVYRTTAAVVEQVADKAADVADAVSAVVP